MLFLNERLVQCVNWPKAHLRFGKPDRTSSDLWDARLNDHARLPDQALSQRAEPDDILGHSGWAIGVLGMRLPSIGAFAVTIALLSAAGCVSEEVALLATGPLDDLERIPQDAMAFAHVDGSWPLEFDESQFEKFEDYWYGPWDQIEPKVCTPAEFGWAAASFPKHPIFGPNLLEVSASRLEAVTANARLVRYPSQAARGITLRNTSMRALPSADPFFRDFRKAGEGYPFDYNQNSAVWAGTPLFLSHVSQDGRFFAAESPYTCGWIDSRDVARVDDGFVATYRSANLAAVRRDRLPIVSEGSGFLFEGRIGMLLPTVKRAEPGVHLLVPVADKYRRASMTHVRVSDRSAARVPFPFSPEEVAKLINEILGQPYGWGGLGGYRDCSSTILDLFLPFALPLPRNSGQQADAGRNVTIEHLLPAEKRELILAAAVPFRTILNLSGHNMLYLGALEGSPVAFHTIWGLRTESADASSSGRYLIGKSVITSLSPGREITELSRSRGDLLKRIKSFTLLGEQ